MKNIKLSLRLLSHRLNLSVLEPSCSIACLGVITLTGCYTASNFANAKLVEPGKPQTTMAAGYATTNTNFDVVDNESESALKYSTFNSVPILASARFGINEYFDAGFYVPPLPLFSNPLALLLNFGVDFKLGIVRKPPLYSALGLGFRYQGSNIQDINGSNDTELETREVFLPIYLRYDVQPTFALYANPGLIYREYGATSGTSIAFYKNSGESVTRQRAETLLGGVTVGLLAGGSVRFNAEYSIFKSFSNSRSVQPELLTEQITLGLQFGP